MKIVAKVQNGASMASRHYFKNGMPRRSIHRFAGATVYDFMSAVKTTMLER
jgi:hypothetical protein